MKKAVVFLMLLVALAGCGRAEYDYVEKEVFDIATELCVDREGFDIMRIYATGFMWTEKEVEFHCRDNSVHTMSVKILNDKIRNIARR